jgi:hypothetical protein
MKWPFLPSLIGNGILYGVREDDETGDIKVIRHNINNWESFREE